MIDFNTSYVYIVGLFGSIKSFVLHLSNRLKSCYIEVKLNADRIISFYINLSEYLINIIVKHE